MTHLKTIKTSGLAHLSRLFASAIGEASRAMCRWTGGQISLTLDEVLEVPLEGVCAKLGVNDELSTMIVLGLDGELGGEMILAFDESSARRLAASLSRRPLRTDAKWSPIEQSALCETGNILGCAYMNALTRLLPTASASTMPASTMPASTMPATTTLVPTPPQFIRDFAASVIQQALISQAADGEKVLLCRTIFRHQGEELCWRVIFFPTKKLRTLLQTTSDTTPQNPTTSAAMDDTLIH